MRLIKGIILRLIHLPFICVFIIGVASVCSVEAQQADLLLQIEGNPVISNAQIINTTTFLTQQDKGAGLFTLLLKNQNSASAAEDLYLDIRISSDSRGLLWHQFQIIGQPFSLDPGQQVYSPNVNALGLPGVGEQVLLQGGLTSQGKQLVNDSQGSTRLPADIYTLTVCVYQGWNEPRGGQQIICDSQKFGSKIVEDVNDIYLTNPGDIIGAEAEISVVYPFFSWSGQVGLNYRLIIVEARENRSPESLINSALNSAPIMINGRPAAGTLLTYENADVVLRNSNFQYPVTGVQNFQSGKTYYWQVFTVLNEETDESISSEIWSFRITENSGLITDTDGSLREILIKLIGREQYLKLKRSGFNLEAVEIGDDVYTAEGIVKFLNEFNSKMMQDSVTVVNN